MAKTQINTRQDEDLIEWLLADAAYSRGGRIGLVYEEALRDYKAKRKAMKINGLHPYTNESFIKEAGDDWPEPPEDPSKKGRPQGS